MSRQTIRETVAALGVIGSLVFVGMEVRQSNAQARAAAYQAIGIATAEAFDSWAEDSLLVGIRFKTAAEMDSTEWQHWTLKFMVFARLGETVLLQIEQKILRPDAMERLGYGGWKTIADDPKYGCLWPLIRTGVSDSFREFVEEGQALSRIDCSEYAVPGT